LPCSTTSLFRAGRKGVIKRPSQRKDAGGRLCVPRLCRCCRRTSDFRKRSRSAHQVDGSEDECLLLAPPDSRRVVCRRTLVPSCRDRHRHPAQTAWGSRLSSPPGQEPVVSEISDSSAAHQNCCRSKLCIVQLPLRSTARKTCKPKCGAQEDKSRRTGDTPPMLPINARVDRALLLDGRGPLDGLTTSRSCGLLPDRRLAQNRRIGSTRMRVAYWES